MLLRIGTRRYNQVTHRQITLIFNDRYYWTSGWTAWKPQWRFSFRPLYWGIYLVIDSNQLSNCLSNNQCRRLFDDEVHGNYISRTRSTIWAVVSSLKIYAPVHLSVITLNENWRNWKLSSHVKRRRPFNL